MGLLRSLTTPTALDALTFEKREKAYGAYYLRTRYALRLLSGFGITIGIALILVLGKIVIGLLPDRDLLDDEVLLAQAAASAGVQQTEVKLQDIPEELLRTPREDVAPIVIPDSIPIVPQVPKPPKSPRPLNPNSSKDSTQGGPKTGGNGKGGSGNSNSIVVEKVGGYPGGVDAWRKYMVSHMKYPQIDKVMGRAGTVTVQVKVNPDGKLSDFKVLRSVSNTLDAEALRLVRESGKWDPWVRNDIPVTGFVNIEVRFALL